MRRSLVFALALGATLFSSVAEAQAARPGVAVLPFENGGSYGQDQEIFDALRVGLQAMLISELSRNPALRAIDRAGTKTAGSQEDGRNRLMDAQSAAQLGSEMGARYVVLGAFMDHYGRFRLDARIIDTESGTIVAVVSNDPALKDRRELHAMIQSVAARIAAEAGLPAPPAGARSVPSEAITRFSQALLALDRGDRPKAIEHFRSALEASPGFTEAQSGLRALQPS